MVDKVTFEKTTYNELPFKFEAGTTNFVGAIGMSEALNFINDIGLDNIARREAELLELCNRQTNRIVGYKDLWKCS